MIALKDYQRRSLDALGTYFRQVAALADNPVASIAREAARHAFEATTEAVGGVRLPYRDVSEGQPEWRDLRGIPYVCVRIPTGGGKTVVAAHTPALALRHLLGAERGVVLWLVPSSAILGQTLGALRDRDHPYRQALTAEVGAVTVVDLDGALALTETTLDTETVVIVSTMQSFKREDPTSLRVFAENGDFLRPLASVPRTGPFAEGFDRYDDGRVVPSLANVLRARRPVVIMDEAHNERTPLSFGTLARLAPSCIVEFTATPDHTDTPSNVLVQASASELKAEQMIRLPISLTIRPLWQDVVTAALQVRSRLEEEARREEADGGRYIRPILLVQAEARSKTRDTVSVDVVREFLNDAGVPGAWVRMATGAQWELDGEDLLSPASEVRVLITVQALREGWDCPFAYVLATVSNVAAPTAVEQVVGRVLRMPYARATGNPALDRAYVFASSLDFSRTLNGLTGALVASGFEREEARTLIQAALPPVRQGRLDDGLNGGGGLFDALDPMESVAIVDVPLAPSDVPSTLPIGVQYDPARQALRVPATVAGDVRDELTAVLPERAAAFLTTALSSRLPPSQRGVRLSVPRLWIRGADLFEPLDGAHIAETVAGSWSLDKAPADLPGYAPDTSGGLAFEVDASEGRVSSRLDTFVGRLQAQAELFTRDLRWEQADLVRWLDRRLVAPDLSQAVRTRYIARVVLHLLAEKHPLDVLIRDRARLARMVQTRLEQLRLTARREAVQLLLDGTTGVTLETSPDQPFQFPPEAVYSRLYDGRHRFERHYYPVVGAFDSDEEFGCAQYLDSLGGVGTWVRNPTSLRHGFWLQTSTGHFYPDFVCRLEDDRTLVVEYKGAHLYDLQETQEKRLIGDVWARQSAGACVFVMPHPEAYQSEIARALAS